MPQQYSATSVKLLTDVDYGEGWVTFCWPHELYGYDELRIDLDGHCSRRMPIHSGAGPPEIAELRRDGIKLRFDPILAQKLELQEEIEILFSLSNAEFAQLRRVVDYLEGR
jgi:hypothetical protein